MKKATKKRAGKRRYSVEITGSLGDGFKGSQVIRVRAISRPDAERRAIALVAKRGGVDSLSGRRMRDPWVSAVGG